MGFETPKTIAEKDPDRALELGGKLADLVIEAPNSMHLAAALRMMGPNVFSTLRAAVKEAEQGLKDEQGYEYLR